MTTPEGVEHFFRHEYGRLVSMLSCRAGVQHIEAVEDVVNLLSIKPSMGAFEDVISQRISVGG